MIGLLLIVVWPWARGEPDEPRSARSVRSGTGREAVSRPVSLEGLEPHPVSPGEAQESPSPPPLPGAEGHEAGRRIRVVDGRTGAPLPSARVYLRLEAVPNLATHSLDVFPDRATLSRAPIPADEDGIVVLREGEECWWVIAQGYAWHPLLCAATAGEDPIIVALRDSGGALLLHVHGWRAQEGLHVFAREGDQATRLPEPSDEGILHLEGVRPGSYRIVVKEGRYFWVDDGTARVYADGDALVVAGDQTRVDLNLELADPEHVSSRILIDTSSAWDWEGATVVWVGAESRNAHIEQELEFLPSPSGRLLASRAMDLPPGHYELRMDLPGLSWTLRAELKGRFFEHLVRMPGPAEVNVYVTAQAPGPLAEDIEAHWALEDEEGGVTRGFATVPPDTGKAVFRVPAGELKVYLLSQIYLDQEVDVGLVRPSSSTEVNFAVTPAGSIELLIYEGGRLLDHGVVWVGSEPRDGQTSPGAGAFRVVASGDPISIGCLSPGLYLVRLTVDGYETQEIDGVVVVAGQAKELRIDLPE